MRLTCNKKLKTFICATLICFLCMSQTTLVWAAPLEESYVLPEFCEYVALDVSDGGIEISQTGYRIGDAKEEVPFTGVYYLSGTASKNCGVKVLSGTHTLLLKDVEIDLRTEEECCPLVLSADTEVVLNVNGNNTLYAGAGRSGIELESGACLDIRVFGEGSLDVMSYPEWRSNRTLGGQAVFVPLTASVSYPYDEGDDRVDMYGGISRREHRKVYVYSGQVYLGLDFDVEHAEHLLSKEADCVHAQICLLCGEELAVTNMHTLEKHATCTEDGMCCVCGEVVEKAAGHKGAWKVLEYLENRSKRHEMLTCSVCHQTFNRIVDIKK